MVPYGEIRWIPKRKFCSNRPFQVVAVLDDRLSSLQVPNQLPLLQKFFQLRLHGHLEKFPGLFPEIFVSASMDSGPFFPFDVFFFLKAYSFFFAEMLCLW
ncbi:MAG: hypothetical protein M0Z25_07210 [Nitrospiraceae bacterium]|nr:hypothetical protein [Nitrospiraceae bacterium]